MNQFEEINFVPNTKKDRSMQSLTKESKTNKKSSEAEVNHARVIKKKQILLDRSSNQKQRDNNRAQARKQKIKVCNA